MDRINPEHHDTLLGAISAAAQEERIAKQAKEAGVDIDPTDPDAGKFLGTVQSAQKLSVAPVGKTLSSDLPPSAWKKTKEKKTKYSPIIGE